MNVRSKNQEALSNGTRDTLEYVLVPTSSPALIAVDKK